MNFIPRGIIPDVSFYQDDPDTPQSVDFEKMKLAGVEGIIIRAGQNTWLDRDFTRNWRAAREAGLRRGAYWFYDPRNEPIEQANRFTNLFVADPPEFGLWSDLEYPLAYGGLYQGETNWRKFCDRVRSNFKGIVGIYTANWWWSGQIIREYEYWGTYPLWVAQYTSNPANVILPRGWIKAALWQFTDRGDGEKYGVESAGIDLNYTSDDFYALFGGSIPPGNGDEMQYVKGTTTAANSAGGLRVRSEPSLNAAVLGSLPLGTVVEGWLDSGWIKIKYNGVDAYISAQWVNYQIVEPPPSSSSNITGVRFSGEVVFDFEDGSQDVWHISDVPLERGPA
ncbi:hypothetical protein FBQ81_03300 [Chloroflexi bacterium CFX6]|nr:hypothetical protein [Chloroflexi bacterium CFX6]